MNARYWPLVTGARSSRKRGTGIEVELRQPLAGALAELVQVVQAGRAVAEGQVLPSRPRVRDRVVDAVAHEVGGRGRVERPDRPLLLEVRDVPEVPHDR